MATWSGYFEGQFVEGLGDDFPVENPADENILETVRGLSVDQYEDAITSARRAFDSGCWSNLALADRAGMLRRFADALISRTSHFVDIVSKEAGCPLHSSVMASQVKKPMAQCHEIIDFFLSLPETEDNPLPLDHRFSASGNTMQSIRRYMPVGVVSAIAAYNFPFLTGLWKIMPALIAGNTVLFRPSPLTPLSARLFAEAADEAKLPPGVLNVVIEGGFEGARLLTTHPAVDMVAFTGSTAVGSQVMTQAAPTMKKLQLELGGKSAQIFLPDAVDRAPMMAAVVCTGHAGQGCAHGTRIFVPNDCKEDVLERAAAMFAAVKVGSTKDPQTEMGPVINAAQVKKCEHFVSLAVEKGGRLVAGGKRPEHLSRGHFFEPTLLDLPDNNNPAAQEEIFGPVVSVIGYRDLDHAVEMANNSRYALSGYVHGNDARLAVQTGRRIRSGTVHVNTAIMSTFVSMGGHGASGVGRERGVEGMRIYQHLGCMNIGG